MFLVAIFVEVIFCFHKKKLRLSSIFKKLRSSSIFKNIEVVFHISSCWVKITLHIENQLPMLHRIVQIVIIPGVVWCGFNITDNNTTPGDFVLGWPGLWQYKVYLLLLKDIQGISSNYKLTYLFTHLDFPCVFIFYREMFNNNYIAYVLGTRIFLQHAVRKSLSLKHMQYNYYWTFLYKI